MGLALGAYKPAKISQDKVNLSPDSLKILIATYFCHFLASKCSPSWPNLAQSWGHVVLQNAGFSWGLALEAHKLAKISQHEVNFSLYRPIAACGLGGDREAPTIKAARRVCSRAHNDSQIAV